MPPAESAGAVHVSVLPDDRVGQVDPGARVEQGAGDDARCGHGRRCTRWACTVTSVERVTAASRGARGQGGRRTSSRRRGPGQSVHELGAGGSVVRGDRGDRGRPRRSDGDVDLDVALRGAGQGGLDAGSPTGRCPTRCRPTSISMLRARRLWVTSATSRWPKPASATWSTSRAISAGSTRPCGHHQRNPAALAVPGFRKSFSRSLESRREAPKAPPGVTVPAAPRHGASGWRRPRRRGNDG